MFLAAPTPGATRGAAEAAAAGRAGTDLLVLSLASVVVGRTEAQAREKYEEYCCHASVQAGLAHYSASIGIDLSRPAPHEPIAHRRTDANNSVLDAITYGAAKPWTLARITAEMVLGSRWRPIIGSGAQVAAAAGVDGFDLSRTVTPESLADFVVPELQAREAYKTAYAPGTLGRKLFGAGDRIPGSHVAATYRAASPAGLAGP